MNTVYIVHTEESITSRWLIHTVFVFG